MFSAGASHFCIAFNHTSPNPFHRIGLASKARSPNLAHPPFMLKSHEIFSRMSPAVGESLFSFLSHLPQSQNIHFYEFLLSWDVGSVIAEMNHPNLREILRYNLIKVSIPKVSMRGGGKEKT